MRRLLLASVFALASVAAHAQAPVLNMIQTGQGTSKPVGTDALSAPMPVDNTSLAASTTQVIVSANGTTLAVVATMPATAAVTNYICGFTVDATATASGTGTITIVGLLGGTMTMFYAWAAAPAVAPKAITFTPCLPASAANIAIVVNSPAAGVGGFNSANVWGYRK